MRPPVRGGWTIASLCAAAVVLAIAVVALAGPRGVREDPRGDRAARTPPGACPAVVPAGDGAPWWTADVEDGTLRDWRRPQTALGDVGGGEYDSGSGWASASRAEAHSGAWAARLTLSNGRGGTRMFRWRELRQHRDAVLRVWLHVPRPYRLTGPRSSGRYWNIFQFKSRSPSGRNDPLWFVNVANPSPGRLRLELIWWHRTLQGPQRGQSGFRRFTQDVAAVPVGRWFRLTARLRQSRGFDGVLCVWQDAHLLFALSDVRTSFSNCSVSTWCASNEWSVNNYSDGIAPAPAVIYADDASIAPR